MTSTASTTAPATSTILAAAPTHLVSSSGSSSSVIVPAPAFYSPQYRRRHPRKFLLHNQSFHLNGGGCHLSPRQNLPQQQQHPQPHQPHHFPSPHHGHQETRTPDVNDGPGHRGYGETNWGCQNGNEPDGDSVCHHGNGNIRNYNGGGHNSNNNNNNVGNGNDDDNDFRGIYGSRPSLALSRRPRSTQHDAGTDRWRQDADASPRDAASPLHWRHSTPSSPELRGTSGVTLRSTPSKDGAGNMPELEKPSGGSAPAPRPTSTPGFAGKRRRYLEDRTASLLGIGSVNLDDVLSNETQRREMMGKASHREETRGENARETRALMNETPRNENRTTILPREVATSSSEKENNVSSRRSAPRSAQVKSGQSSTYQVPSTALSSTNTKITHLSPDSQETGNRSPSNGPAGRSSPDLVCHEDATRKQSSPPDFHSFQVPDSKFPGQRSKVHPGPSRGIHTTEGMAKTTMTTTSIWPTTSTMAMKRISDEAGSRSTPTTISTSCSSRAPSGSKETCAQITRNDDNNPTRTCAREDGPQTTTMTTETTTATTTMTRAGTLLPSPSSRARLHNEGNLTAPDMGSEAGGAGKGGKAEERKMPDEGQVGEPREKTNNRRETGEAKDGIRGGVKSVGEGPQTCCDLYEIDDKKEEKQLKKAGGTMGRTNAVRDGENGEVTQAYGVTGNYQVETSPITGVTNDERVERIQTYGVTEYAMEQGREKVLRRPTASQKLVGTTPPACSSSFLSSSSSSAVVASSSPANASSPSPSNVWENRVSSVSRLGNFTTKSRGGNVSDRE